MTACVKEAEGVDCTVGVEDWLRVGGLREADGVSVEDPVVALAVREGLRDALIDRSWLRVALRLGVTVSVRLRSGERDAVEVGVGGDAVGDREGRLAVGLYVVWVVVADAVPVTDLPTVNSRVLVGVSEVRVTLCET